MDVVQPGITTATANAPYSTRGPSPPYIHVPMRSDFEMEFTPSKRYLPALGLTVDDLSVISGGMSTQFTDENVTHSWTYESRRTAQPVLDWLYLGPASITRSRDFLQSEHVTMILAIRPVPTDARPNPILIMGPTAATRELEIPIEAVEAQNVHQLSALLGEAVTKINNHMLHVHRHGALNDGHFQRGKVLVVCETGNDRSAMCVAAYIMAMFGTGLVDTLTFLSQKRFSASYNEDSKRLLLAWGDVLKARLQVAKAREIQMPDQAPSSATAPDSARKRGIDDTYEDHSKNSDSTINLGSQDDMNRFNGRTFVPFTDTPDGMDES